ncbi:MAG: sigma-54 dependent transcriptional regulator [Muribaculaceae bacterium]|nr:sigma-54 dependent transcriptional regulator [Muribaculaceae bacterium]
MAPYLSSTLDTDIINSIKQRFSIVGNSPALYNAIERAVKVAPIDLSVLIYGESGTGKEFFPKIIHNSGARKHKKYIAVNCGAIPEGTIDSELFGHEKGAFTGAVATRKGYFEEADGGTIFLDEVAELPLTTQARLLRVLETGEFLKVGSSEVQHTNVRIVAATNVDLQRAVRQGKFREDLYYRLSTVIIEVPPLRDRGDDIFLLARKFTADFSEKYLTAPISFSEDARHAMALYGWPGNVRQLKNVVEQLSLFDAGKEISRAELLEALPTPDRAGAEGRNVPYADVHSYEQEREMLWQTLFSLRAEIASLKDMTAAAGMSEGTHIRQHGPTLLSQLSPRAASHAKDLIAPATDASEPEDALTLEDAERKAVADALARAHGDKKAAAEQLNISPRTLYRKIREYGLD